MSTILVTRPEPGAEETAGRLRQAGHTPLLCPLLTIEMVGGPGPEMEGVAALVATSPNGVRSMQAYDLPRQMPVYAVGDRTAEAARDAGFGRVTSAGGDLRDLVRLIRQEPPAAPGRLLHVSGADVAGDLGALLAPDGPVVTRHIGYRAVPVEEMAPAVAAAMRGGEVTHVLLFSARTADSFVNLCRQAGLTDTISRLTALCLSAAVARAASGLAWRETRIAASPDADALMALLPPA